MPPTPVGKTHTPPPPGAMRDFMERTVGTPFEDVLPRDGSGLGRQNVVTARAMVGLLRWADRQPWRNVWRGALAKAGGPGTLKNRLQDLTFAGKTGSLNRVLALSGYLTRRDGTELAVSVIVNHYAASDAAVRAAMDDWVRSLDVASPHRGSEILPQQDAGAKKPALDRPFGRS